MARLLSVCSLCAGSLAIVITAAAEPIDVTACDIAHASTACQNSAIEVHEEQEGAAVKLDLLQTRKQNQVVTYSSTDADESKEHIIKPKPTSEKQKEEQSTSEAQLVSKDHNGKMCMLCDKPLPDRVDKEYTEMRKDCGGLTSAAGPSAEILAKPVAKLFEISEAGVVKNGFCQLNFAKSCVDAAANKDYLYWAKSIDFKASPSKNSDWDGRYCRLNGFLAPNLVGLQHDFTATQAKASELCKTKYAKYNLENITFNDMMAASRDDDNFSPSLHEAERLAAWNCAMGDLGCDMALCAYSFCEKGSGTGLYEECLGWHPVRGMPVPK